VKTRIQDRLRKAKRRVEQRLAGTREDQGRPMFAGKNVRVELADKVRAIGVGGIGVVHRLAQEVGLVDAIDRRLHLLKIHRPYHESDHVLNLAYNALCDGTRLEDIELRRNDEVFLDALENLEEIADNLPKSEWQKLLRPPRYEIQTDPRQKPVHVKGRIVLRREFEVLTLQGEDYAEFEYQPTACDRAYRMIVVRKNISHMKGGTWLFDEIRYFFYITNDWEIDAEDVVFEANDRCNQENLIAQLAGGVRALAAPVDNLYSNWAYMVMASLAWNLKAWWALRLPEEGRWREKHEAEKARILRMEFKTFLNAFIKIPCQIVRGGRQLICRVLSYNPHLPVFFRLCAALRC